MILHAVSLGVCKIVRTTFSVYNMCYYYEYIIFDSSVLNIIM